MQSPSEISCTGSAHAESRNGQTTHTKSPHIQTPHAQTSYTENSYSQSRHAEQGSPREDKAITKSEKNINKNTTERNLADNAAKKEEKKDDPLFSSLESDKLGLGEAMMEKAKKGDGSVLYYIGSLYHHRREYEKAVAWFQKAVEKRNPPAHYMIGTMYEEGKLFDDDSFAAMSWYLKAAYLGESDSCSRIGDMFDKGLGIPKDNRKALDWYSQGDTNIGDDEEYVYVLQQDIFKKKLVIESMQRLEEAREKASIIKIKELQIDNQALNEEVLSLRELVTELINTSYRENQNRQGREDEPPNYGSVFDDFDHWGPRNRDY